MQKRNRDCFRLKHRTNSFNKPQNNDIRVCLIEKIYDKLISLKHGINIHKKNSVLKQDAVIEYLHEVYLSPD